MKRLLKSWAWKLFPYAGLELKTRSGLLLQIRERGAWGCLEEVFVSGAYDPFFQHLGLVNGWLDLGCNVGFFSLGLLDYLRATGRPGAEPRALLVDANELCVATARQAVAQNNLTQRWSTRHAVVGPPGETVRFAQFRFSIHSGIFSAQRGEKTLVYPTVDLPALIGGLPREIDFLKVDIEGAERFVFDLPKGMLDRFRYILCEWHSPHFSGPELRRWIEHNGMELLVMRSQAAEGYDLSRGHSWDSPVGMALWQNPGWKPVG